MKIECFGDSSSDNIPVTPSYSGTLIPYPYSLSLANNLQNGKPTVDIFLYGRRTVGPRQQYLSITETLEGFGSRIKARRGQEQVDDFKIQELYFGIPLQRTSNI